MRSLRVVVLMSVSLAGGCSTPSTTVCIGEGARVGQMLLPRMEDGVYRVVTRVVGRAEGCRGTPGTPVLAEVVYRRGDVVERPFWEAR